MKLISFYWKPWNVFFFLENLLRLWVARCDGRQVKLKSISDRKPANAGWRSHLSTDNDQWGWRGWVSILFYLVDLKIKISSSSRFGDGDDDDGAASVAASKSSKLPVLDKLGDEDGNISVGSVTNVVKDRVGNLLGKGIGGLSTKFSSGSWF